MRGILRSAVPALGVAVALLLPAAADGSDSGVISGTVTERDGGGPIDEICVSAWRLDGRDRALERIRYTLPDGDYRLDDLSPGEYAVNFGDCYHGPFEPPRRYTYEAYDGRTGSDRLDRADVLPVGAGEELSGIDATLRPAPTVSGRVTSESDGRPLEGICAEAYIHPESSGFTPAYEATTGPDGRYRLEGLEPSDRWTMSFEGCADRNEFLGETYGEPTGSLRIPMFALGAGEQKVADVALTPAASIRGRLIDAVSGAPVEHACVRLFQRDEGSIRIRSTRTDGDGRYALRRLEADRYLVEFRPCRQGPDFQAQFYDDQLDCDRAAFIEPGVGENVVGIDAQLAPPVSRPPSDIACWDRLTGGEGGGGDGGELSQFVLARSTQRPKGPRPAVKLRVRSEGRAKVTAWGKVRAGAKAYRLRTESKAIGARDGSKKLKLRLKGRRATRKVRRALRRGARVRAEVRAGLRAADGGRQRARLRIRLR